jgi:hypothetical protein
MNFSGDSWFTILLTVLTSFSSGGTVTSNITEPSQMVKTVLARAPVGSSIDKAQSFMEKEGFKCSRQTNATFQNRQGIDYVYCDRQRGAVVVRRWQVALVQKENKVVEVLANTGLIGP